MKIGGLGEFENIRKASGKDKGKKAESPSAEAAAESSRSDEIRISPEARMMGKLKQIPDVRQEKIDKVLSKMEHGELMTPEAVKEGVARMLENMAGGGISEA
jgi:hypothetical protein